MTAERRVPFGRPWITDDDRRAVARVLDSPILTHGPECAAFEDGFATWLGEGAHAVSVSSCMAALHLAYLHFGIGPGDEVIVPAQTHVATAHAVELVGATPVFVDCDPATGNVTAAGIRAAIGERTRAIGLVHYLGIPCDMDGIVAVAREHSLLVIEDCALAVGARPGGVHVGLHGDAGCFSFYPVKHLTSAEGGMFVTRHPEVAVSVRRLRGFGIDRTHQERTAPGMYDVPGIGLNYRMSELQAALGRSQLARVEEMLARRAASFAVIARALGAIPGAHIVDGPGNSHYCLSLVLGDAHGDRDAIAAALNAAGVGTSVYYPQPVPRMSYYRGRYGYDPAEFPAAERLSDRAIALPVGPHLADGDAEWIGETVVGTIKEMQA